MRIAVMAVAALVGSACDARPRAASGRSPGTYDREIAVAIDRARAIYPVPAALVRAVIRQESAFDARALSRAGARGLMQVMPRNAPGLGVTPDELWIPEKNVIAGVRLLATLLRRYEGDVVSALVAYNARPRAKFAPLPQNGETPAYVWRVLAFYEQYRCEEGFACPRGVRLARRGR